jgi:hypothetical protein
MPYKQLILGETPEQDYVFEKNYDTVQFHEDGTVHKLSNIGQCMIVAACGNSYTFEAEFLHGTGLSVYDFEMHYIYNSQYMYIPKDKESFKNALQQLLNNTRRSGWCLNAMFHI